MHPLTPATVCLLLCAKRAAGACRAPPHRCSTATSTNCCHTTPCMVAKGGQQCRWQAYSDHCTCAAAAAVCQLTTGAAEVFGHLVCLFPGALLRLLLAALLRELDGSLLLLPGM